MTNGTSLSTANVPVQSAWLSKINWTQAVGVTATVIALASANKYNLPAEQQAELVASIQGIQAVATWIFRTWFNGTVAPGSLPK